MAAHIFRYGVFTKPVNMAGYLLLRNNIKSGPYQLEELIHFGLKPYDLVWAEGKSAAWRYGSEIEELKPYAPAVEEQPYDRFFKKKPAETQPAPEKKPVTPQETPVKKKYEKYIPSKSVFVTLPGQKTPVAESPASPAPAPVIIVTENPAAAQTHQPAKLEEISERYAKTLQQRKTKIARKSFWMTNLKRASVIGSLVMLGVIAGFFIRSGSDTDHTLAEQAVQPLPVSPVAATTAPVQQPEQEPVTENTPAVMATASPADIQRTALVNKMNLQSGMHTPLLQEKQQVQQAGLKREPASPKEFAAPALLPEVKKNELTGERNRTVRDHDDEEKPASKTNTTVHATANSANNDISRLVSVASNDYKRVAFGGIRNLELTVTNGSQYRLDKVTVELQYLKPDEQPLRTELIQFRSVAPNGSLTMKIKDTNRGMKVSCRIVNVQPLSSETALSAF